MQIYEIVREAAQLAATQNNTELQHKLFGVLEYVANLKSENSQLNERVQQCEEKSRLRDAMVFENGVYWILKDPMARDTADTPVCPTCWAKNALVMRLKIETFNSITRVHCHSCKGSFTLARHDSGPASKIVRGPNHNPIDYD